MTSELHLIYYMEAGWDMWSCRVLSCWVNEKGTRVSPGLIGKSLLSKHSVCLAVLSCFALGSQAIRAALAAYGVGRHLEASLLGISSELIRISGGLNS